MADDLTVDTDKPDDVEELEITVGNISKQRSEILAPIITRGGAANIISSREVTFDDLFRENFIPLDARKKVGNYVIGRIIGEGSFSKVRIARHVISSEKLAVKVLPKKTILKRQDVRRRFIRDVRSLRNITHRNVVRLHEVMETAGNYYIVMDLVTGGSFKEYLNKRMRLPEEEARHFMHQIGVAVQYMHSQCIVHRDLKPDNFILDGDIIKIVDFGMSASIRRCDSMTTQCGSLAYAAPEIFHKEPYTKLVDVWSIGVILFLAVTGCMPFNISGKSSAEVYKVILGGYDIPLSTHLSEACQHVISQTLTIDPDLRISSTDLTAHPWFKHAQNRTTKES